MIEGCVTTRDVILHPFLIAQGFGWIVLFHALLAVLSRRHTTFLELIAEVGR